MAIDTIIQGGRGWKRRILARFLARRIAGKKIFEKKWRFCVAFSLFLCSISMERLKYISLVTELRQIAVARAMSLLDGKDDAEDVAGEVLLKLWERHKNLRDNTEEVRHLADRMARNLALNLLQHRRRHPILRIFFRQDNGKEKIQFFKVCHNLNPFRL